MLHLARALARRFGVDRAIAYTVLGRLWAVLAGPVTLLLVVRYLSPQEQGFYYTFGSILGLQVFFELGLAGVIGLSASHERAALQWTPQGTLEGDPVAKARLAAILKIGTRWFAAIAFLFGLIVLPAGLWFFASHEAEPGIVRWRGPWLWVAGIQAASLLATPLFAVVEGCGLIAQVAKIRLYRAVVGTSLGWMFLAFHWKLYAAPVFNTIGVLLELGWLFLYQRFFLRDLLRTPTDVATLNWRTEIWPFQWKLAVSGVSGYFIFLLFNPVLFAYRGAVEAGRMGLATTVMATISTIGIAWVATKSAPFGMLIARREFAALDRMFFPALWQSTVVTVLGGGAFWLATVLLNLLHHPIASRLLMPGQLALLVCSAVVNHVVAAEAIYLRAHKQEPFFLLSLVVAVLTGTSTLVLGRAYGATGMMTGYLAVSILVGLTFGTYIFVQKRKLWRAEPLSTLSVTS